MPTSALRLLTVLALAAGCATPSRNPPAGRAEGREAAAAPAARPSSAAEEAVRSGRAGAGASKDAGADNAFLRLDKNGDGYLTLPEAAADPALRSEFQGADRDGDFRLDPAEFAKAR